MCSCVVRDTCMYRPAPLQIEPCLLDDFALLMAKSSSNFQCDDCTANLLIATVPEWVTNNPLKKAIFMSTIATLKQKKQ